jgi:hypothetical protein
MKCCADTLRVLVAGKIDKVLCLAVVFKIWLCVVNVEMSVLDAKSGDVVHDKTARSCSRCGSSRSGFEHSPPLHCEAVLIL